MLRYILVSAALVLVAACGDQGQRSQSSDEAQMSLTSATIAQLCANNQLSGPRCPQDTAQASAAEGATSAVSEEESGQSRVRVTETETLRIRSSGGPSHEEFALPDDDLPDCARIGLRGVPRDTPREVHQAATTEIRGEICPWTATENTLRGEITLSTGVTVDWTARRYGTSG